MGTAQTKANNKYKLKSYDRIEINVSKGRKTEIQSHALAHNDSLNGFINRAIAETMTRDNEKDAQQ